MKPIFNKIKLTRPGKNAFDLSHEKKLSCHMADLIPILLQEVVPGDRFRVNQEIFARLAPMLAPVMHRMNIYTHYFFVPNRIIWDNWETFITGGVDGLQAPNFPKITLTDTLAGAGVLKAGSLWDYMGYGTTELTSGLVAQTYNALPFRAYQKIYNEYYRDQTLQTEVAFTTGDTVNATEALALTTLRKRCWEKDYFTSALPWSQRGGEVLLPLDSTVTYKAVSDVYKFDGSTPATGALGADSTGTPHQLLTGKSSFGTGGSTSRIENIQSISNATTTINDLRRATRLQEWLEKNARAGSRYIEQILAHFGVQSSDARLQRPEYLGGSKQPLVISEVLQTAPTVSGQTPLGTMGGHGVSIGGQHGFSKEFEEHGMIFGIMSILPRTAYGQGMPKLAKKFDKFDYFWPEFANIGEQPITAEELYWAADGTAATDNVATFGYTPRYAEYKFANSSVHGDFKTTADYWHMGRKFTTRPALNTVFVGANPTKRIFAVTDANVHEVYIQMFNDVKAIRPMPVFGTPTL